MARGMVFPAATAAARQPVLSNSFASAPTGAVVNFDEHVEPGLDG